MKKYILHIMITLLVVLGFSACGDNASSNTPQAISITTYCVDNNISGAIETYVPLQSGDTIVKDANNTVVEIYHKENNNKYVCLINGTAHIVR